VQVVQSELWVARLLVSVQAERPERRAGLLIIRRSWVRAPPAPPAVLIPVVGEPWTGLYTDVGGPRRDRVPRRSVDRTQVRNLLMDLGERAGRFRFLIRPGRSVHRGVRRGAGRRRGGGGEDPAAQPESETSGCILHLFGLMRGVLVSAVLVVRLAVGLTFLGAMCVVLERRVGAFAFVVEGVAGDEPGVVPDLDGLGGHAEAAGHSGSG